MPLFEVKAGGPDIDDGVYPVMLVKIEGPKTVTAQRGPNAGQDIDLFDWTFRVDKPNAKEDGQELTASTSTASGPKSKMYGYLTALLSGRPPAIGNTYEAKDLVGKFALATVRKDETGWPRIDNLGAMPEEMLAQRIASATGTAVAATVPAETPLRETVAAGVGSNASEDLPF